MVLRKKSENAENPYKRTSRIRLVLLFGGFFGIALAMVGFFLWYYRLQRYQDKLLRYKAIQPDQQKHPVDS